MVSIPLAIARFDFLMIMTVDAMIFLCPMSNFDVTLAEDPSMNSLVSAPTIYTLSKLTCRSS